MYQDNTSIFENILSENSKAHLLETTRWTKFLAIMGFIFLGLMFLGLISVLFSQSNVYNMAPGMAQMGILWMVIFFVLLIGLYIYPIIMLYKFSTNIKSGLLTNNTSLVETGLRCQKNMFKYLGVVTIFTLAMYVLMIAAIAFQSIV
jgi:hypothetical protein